MTTTWLGNCCKAQPDRQACLEQNFRFACCAPFLIPPCLHGGEVAGAPLQQTPSVDSLHVPAGSSTSIASLSGGKQGCTPVGRLPARGSLLAKAGNLEADGLLEEYVLTGVLGQGSFSIVLACTARNERGARMGSNGTPKRTFAVKLIERVEAQPEDIEQETQIHTRLDHPNILKVHRVFFEKCFVCLVADMYEGGNLVNTLCSQGRPVIGGKMVHVGRQMVTAVEYLHGKSIVHRDIKADNFLADRREIMDRHCRVVLADFGFACECRVGDRLKRHCGTQRYWSPEVYDKNYAHKADIWALGVTLYGLVESNFPFQSEWDVKNKEVFCWRVVSPTLADFVKQLLCKQEGSRLSAQRALLHPWIANQEQSVEEGNAEKAVPASPRDLEVLQPERPNPAVAERRLELLERLTGRLPKESTTEFSQGSFDSNEQTPMAILLKACFTVKDKRAGKIRTFEWWPRQKLHMQGFTLLSTAREQRASTSSGGSQFDRIAAQKQILKQLLEDFGVDTTRFGRGDAKTLDRFAEEVETGVSQIMLDAAKHKSLVRVVEVVLLRICLLRPGKDELFMIVSADEQLDGRMHRDLNRLPGSKKLPHENVRAAALRTLNEMPHMANANVSIDFDHTEVFEVEEDSPSYPGFRTVYRKEIVAGVVHEWEPNSGVNCQSKGDRSTKFFSWLTEEECVAKRVTLSAPLASREVCALVPAPLGLRQQALERFLQTNDLDVSAFGKDGAKTLEELSCELSTGESSLVCMPNGAVARIVDVVLLEIVKQGSPNVLVVAKELTAVGSEVRHEEIVLGRLPGSKRRPDESQFITAKRILRRQLGISENHVNFDAEAVCIVEEEKDSPSYPGLHTFYRKRIIPGVMADLTRHTMDVIPQYSSRDWSRGNFPDAIPEEPHATTSRLGFGERLTNRSDTFIGWVKKSLNLRKA